MDLRLFFKLSDRSTFLIIFSFPLPIFFFQIILDMPDCHVIIQGRPNDDVLGPTGTVGLIMDYPFIILVDAGDPWNGSEIVEKLQEFHVTPAQVTHVIITHGHLDHCANLGLFSEATVIMDRDIGRKSNENPRRAEYSTIPKWPYRISRNCEISNLSGHTASDTIVIVHDKKLKRIVVYAGDLVEDSQDLKKFEDASITNVDEDEDLLSSQAFIFETGDVIIPGHGSPFENPNRDLFLYNCCLKSFM